MLYDEAIDKIIDNYGIEIFDNYFYAYSILSDYIKADFEGIKLNNMLFCISKSYNIAKIFQDNGLQDGRKYFETKYDEFNNVCSKSEYVNVINPIAYKILPSEAASARKPKAKVATVKKQANNVALINNTKVYTKLSEVDYKLVDKIVINGKSWWYDLEQKGDSIKVKYNPKVKFILNNGVLNIDLDAVERKTIIIPNDYNKEVVFNTSYLSGYNFGNNIKVNKLSFNSYYLNISLISDYIEDISINTESGSILLIGDFVNTNIDAGSSNVLCKYYFVRSADRNININTTKGKIRINVFNLKKKKTISGLTIQRTEVYDNCLVNYNLKSDKKIKIQNKL